MDVNAHPEVLVIGAGPSGLLAACELLRRGIGVRLVDAATAPVSYSKALLLWPRTVDVLENLGAGPAVEKHSVRINSFRYYSAKRQLADVRFPPELAARALPQRYTEDILRERLTALGGTIEYGVRLLALDRMDFSGDPAATDGVTAVLEHADGRVERCTADWLIGADGAGSAVRAQLGLAFTGSTYASRFVLGDAHIEGGLADDEAHYFQSPAGVLVVVALPDGLFRFFASAPPEQQNGRVDLPLIQRIVDERGPGGIRLVDPQWLSGFRVHRRQADRFQLGRVFLVGDAAHVHSPAGGQGLNTGLQDGHNLAWKLASVIHDEAPMSLLTSYGPERHTVAAQVVRDTDIQTQAWMARNPAIVAGRDLLFRAADRVGLIERGYLPIMAGRRWRYRPADSVALLAPQPNEDRGALRVGTAAGPILLSPKDGQRDLRWTLLTEGVSCPPPAPSVRVLPAQGRWANLSGCARTAFVLVRPDGVIAARGRSAELTRACRWVADLLEVPQTPM
ncbi:FAD-dependent monooxygenase [Actinoalloteichus hymeniacidonis]|uniref:2-polyprenyl-6-methoxyphenol hydroxylase-like oxidoreductase n=1 Tax=Actinoalloteichus hymeniacidonis TaxID=340345 RepID=A0AAC9MYV3_9PSEU|nr:FAD-dependent monooxygenase [Actinoalloteichus hymeniacidonis]AOS64753.1 2-polyprenyl-6-methoxyphenol hydroxylase-like oxidoreductase [Actinoalloteichus hymeniacidonis]MBB5907171.1 3-(3-hydroxy-phenyl)propionate hydroxylase [Actinoalloteichus hymeniacidonis]